METTKRMPRKSRGDYSGPYKGTRHTSSSRRLTHIIERIPRIEIRDHHDVINIFYQQQGKKEFLTTDVLAVFQEDFITEIDVIVLFHHISKTSKVMRTLHSTKIKSHDICFRMTTTA